MTKKYNINIKKNVNQFNEDTKTTGSYIYTTEKLSSRISNSRSSKCIAESFNFNGKTVLDVGCGDGTYTLEFPLLGVNSILGLDPAETAIETAKMKALERGLDNKVKFDVGNIYNLEDYIANNKLDCIILRGVLHHVPDPARAVAGLANFKGTVIVLEPNGNNPVLKLIEKYSHYHIIHEERSFSPSIIKSWLIAAGFKIYSKKVINIVPTFCPDWMAKILHTIEPLIEPIPLLRDIVCGQSVIVARK